MAEQENLEDLGGTITVTVGQDVVDFGSIQQVEEVQVEQDGSTIMLDDQHHQGEIEEVVVKTEPVLEPFEKDKVTLPPIPFSFPGQTFDTKCQKLILNVWDFFKRVKKNPDILDEIRTPQERAAAALHISAATIGKIGKNLKKTGKLETPGARRKRNRPIVDSVSSSDEDVIRNIITEMRANKITPTLPLVLNEARTRLNFNGGATSFRRVLQRMGFRNLSQKIVKTKVIVENNSQTQSSSKQSQQQQIQLQIQPQQFQQIVQPQQQQTYAAVKMIKKEPTASALVAASTSAAQQNQNFNQVIQIAGGGGGQPIQLTQESAATILNAAQAGGLGAGGSQTFYIQQADNTIRPIQIVYASSIS